MVEAKIVGEIRSLLESATTSSQEQAADVGAKISKMLARYNVAQASTGAQESMLETLGARPIPWKEHLALAVGRVCGCRVYSSRSTGKVQFVVVGREVNRVVAQMYYEYLLSAIERLLQENLCGARKTSAYKSEFKRGAAVGLATRLGLKMQAQLAASSARELAANERLEAEISEVAPWLISAKGARRRIARTGAGFDAGVGVPQTVEVDTHLGEQAGPPKFILRLDF